MPERLRIDWRFAALATLAVTCLFTLQNLGGAGAPSFPTAHRHQLVEWGIWLALTPAIVMVTRRVPFAAASPTRWLLQQLGLAFLFAVAAIAITAVVHPLLGTAPVAGPLVSRVAGEMLRYAIIAMAYHTVSAYRAARERETVAARLRAELAEAKLANLEGRLHPHFLFNTLNSIAALVREDPRAAETMVEQLGELLRASLGSQPQREIRLDEEIRLVEQYLAIQQMRYRERLRVTVSVDPASRVALVPQLILQPLVENAVRHGIAPLEAGGSVIVSAVIDGAALRMTVEDDGIGIGRAPAAGAGNGIGLGSVGPRLRHLYGEDQHFEISERVPRGTRVTLALPFRVAAP